jgi:hypothetical protein
MFAMNTATSGQIPNQIVVARVTEGGPEVAPEMRRIAEAIGPAVLVERIRSGRDWFDGAARTVVRRTTLSGILGGLVRIIHE